MQINHVVESECPEVKPFSILVGPMAHGLQKCCDQAGFRQTSLVESWRRGVELLTRRAECVSKMKQFDMTEHVRAGHWPPHRRCRTCILATACQRAHRRQGAPASYVLGLDLIGPFLPAPDDISQKRRYGLVAVLTVPVDQHGKPVLGDKQEQDQAKEGHKDYGPELSPPGGIWDDEEWVEEMLVDKVRAQAEQECEHDQPEVEHEREMSDEGKEGERAVESKAVGAGEPNQQQPKPLEPDPELRWKEIVFVELLDRKTPKSTLLGIGRIHAQLIELGFPITRIHTDSGTEFVTEELREYTAARNITLTHSAPEEHDSNGRAENVVRRLKGQVRANMVELGGDKLRWTVALKAAAATWRANVLQSMGYQIKPVIPCGTKVQVLVRSWLRRNKRDWRLNAADAVVLCPATHVRKGYVVAVGKKLCIITKLNFGEDSKLKVSLESAVRPVAEPAGPHVGSDHIKRRLRTKTPKPPTMRHRFKHAVKALAFGRDRWFEDQQALRLATQANFDLNSAVRFLEASSYGRSGTGPAASRGREGSHYIVGAFRMGGVLGLTRLTKQRDGFAKLLSRIMREVCPQASFSTLCLSVDAPAIPHKDSCNQVQSQSHVVSLVMPSRGGRLWVALGPGDEVSGKLQILEHKGKQIAGQLLDVNPSVSFSPHRLHATESWPKSQRRIVILGYTVGCFSHMNKHDKHVLRECGFRLPDSPAKGGEEPKPSVFSVSPQFSGDSKNRVGKECLEKEQKSQNPNKNSIIPTTSFSHVLCQKPESEDAKVRDGGSPVSGPSSPADEADDDEGAWSFERESSCLSLVEGMKLQLEVGEPETEGEDPEHEHAHDGENEPKPVGEGEDSELDDADEFMSVVSWHEDSEADDCNEDLGNIPEIGACVSSFGDLSVRPREKLSALDRCEQYVRQLDEAQLRLSSFAEDRLAAWISSEPRDLGEGESDSEGEEMKQMRELWERIGNIQHELKSLTHETLGEIRERVGVEEAPSEGEVFQTRVVGLAEALARWEVWEGPAQDELNSLILEKGALVNVAWADVRKWRERGVRVTILPSKLVFSIKAPNARHKVRVVACGNMGPPRDESKHEYKESVFTSSLDITHLRSALAFSAKRGQEVATVDVRTAFLNADLLPRSRQLAEKLAESGESCGGQGDIRDSVQELVVLTPPRSLVQRGLVRPSTLWRVDKAMYGLDTSPRDWGLHRNSVLRDLRIVVGDRELRLWQSFADENLWLISETEPIQDWCGPQDWTPLGLPAKILGWVGVYIDDMIIGGDKVVVQGVLDAVTARWKCGTPEWVGHESSRPLRFLGLDLHWGEGRNLHITQTAYIKELGARYQEQLSRVKASNCPMAPGTGEIDEEPEKEISDIRKGQKILGELLWTAVRSRPDISFAVSKLSQWIAKAPRKVYDLALQTLAYLCDVPDVGLVYEAGEPEKPHPWQRTASSRGLIEVFTDSSFAPEASRSHECCIMKFEGCTVGWHVARQPYMTASSCESELLATCTGCHYGQAHACMISELLQERPRVQVFNDNMAAIAVFTGQSTQWRTRSLRIKARTLKERWGMNFYEIFHVDGVHNGADIGTKPLAAQRHKFLREILGVREENMSRKQSGAKTPSAQELKCLQVVLLACCLCGARGQGPQEPQDGAIDWGVFSVIVIGVVVAWELFKWVGKACFRNITCHVSQVPHQLHEPFAEDAVSDEERETEWRAERDERLRQRRVGQPVRHPEPDQEPAPKRTAFGQPRNPLMTQYADDAIAVLDRADVAFEANQRGMLGLPPYPLVVINPAWGPAPNQPTVRELRRSQAPWGGIASSLHHRPPATERRDSYQLDQARWVLIRWHVRGRVRLFDPTSTRIPIDIRCLSGRRRTLIIKNTDEREIVDDNFRDQAQRYLQSEWVGRTEFEVLPDLYRTFVRDPAEVD